MPGREILETATWLAHLGIIEVRKSLVVRCADPLDGDFPPPVRDCDGHITLRPNVDEGGGDYRCPSCERLVSPVVDEKRRYERMTVVLQRSGIEKFLIDALGASAKGRSFLEGVLKLPTDGLNAFVCLVEFCTDRQYLRRGTAITQPFVYVTVEPDTPARLLKDTAIRHVELVDILTGEVCLSSRLTTVATSPLVGADQRGYPDFRGRSGTGRLSGVPAPRRRRFAVRCALDRLLGRWPAHCGCVANIACRSSSGTCAAVCCRPLRRRRCSNRCRSRNWQTSFKGTKTTLGTPRACVGRSTAFATRSPRSSAARPAGRSATTTSSRPSREPALSRGRRVTG